MNSSECRVCFQRFQAPDRVPKNLNCGHCYCLDCLQTEARKGGLLKCFECRTVEFTKPEQLVTNFNILSDASSNSTQYYCMTCKKEANWECEKNGHAFKSMAAHRNQQTERSQKATQAWEKSLENVLDKTMELQTFFGKQLNKTVQEQDKVKDLLKRLGPNGAEGSGLQDALREGAEREARLLLMERGQQLLQLDKGTFQLNLQTEAGAFTASLDLSAMATTQPDVLIVAQYLFFVLASNGDLQPQSQQRAGQAGRGRGQGGPGYFNGRGGQHGGQGDAGIAGLTRSMANNLSLAVEISDDGVLDLERIRVGDAGIGEMKAEKSALLRSTKKVIELTGLKCDKDPTFGSQLIQKHAPFLENVTLHKVQQEHFNLLGSLRRLKNLKLVGHSGRLAAHLQPQPDCQVRSLYMNLPIPVQLTLWEAFASSLQNVTLRIEVQSSVDVHMTLRRPISHTPHLRTVHLHRKSSDQHNPADCGRQMNAIRNVLDSSVRLTCNMCGTSGAMPPC